MSNRALSIFYSINCKFDEVRHISHTLCVSSFCFKNVYMVILHGCKIKGSIKSVLNWLLKIS